MKVPQPRVDQRGASILEHLKVATGSLGKQNFVRHIETEDTCQTDQESIGAMARRRDALQAEVELLQKENACYSCAFEKAQEQMSQLEQEIQSLNAHIMHLEGKQHTSDRFRQRVCDTLRIHAFETGKGFCSHLHADSEPQTYTKDKLIQSLKQSIASTKAQREEDNSKWRTLMINNKKCRQNAESLLSKYNHLKRKYEETVQAQQRVFDKVLQLEAAAETEKQYTEASQKPSAREEHKKANDGSLNQLFEMLELSEEKTDSDDAECQMLIEFEHLKQEIFASKLSTISRSLRIIKKSKSTKHKSKEYLIW